MHSDSDSDRETENHSNSREHTYNIRLNPLNMAQNFDIKYLNVIPEFDGNPVNLASFIAVCEDLLNTFWNAVDPNHINNKLLMHGITNKITGRAKTVLYCNSNAKNWQTDIKPILKQHFGDNRDLPSLNNNLTNIRQRPRETGLQFLDRIQEILLHICNYIDLNVDLLLRDAQKTLFRNIALRVFVTYLNEPLGSRIRARNPHTLTEASSIMIQEENILYLQKPALQMSQPNNTNLALPKPQVATPLPITYPQRPSQAFPSQPINVQPRVVTQRFPTNRQVFGRQTQQNVFKPNSPQALANAKSNQPTPMSVNTRNTFRPQGRPINRFQSTGPPNFTFQELHNNEMNPEHTNPNSYKNPTHFTPNDTNTDQYFENPSEYNYQYDSHYHELEYNNEPPNYYYEPLISQPDDDNYSESDHFLELPAPETLNR